MLRTADISTRKKETTSPQNCFVQFGEAGQHTLGQIVEYAMFVVGIAIEPELHRIHGAGIVGAEYPVPNDELVAIVLVDVSLIRRMVDSMVARADER